MAIDPKKLKAFAGGADGEPPPAAMAKPAAAPAPSAEDYEDTGEEAEEPEAEEEEKETETSDRFTALLPLLEAHAEELEEATVELNPDSLSDMDAELPPEDAASIEQGKASLDPELLAAMETAFSGGITAEEAHSLGDHLESEDMVSDGDVIAGYLFRLAQTF